MTFKTLVTPSLVLFLAMPTRASFADAPTPSPAPTEAPQQCPVRVFDVISLASNKKAPSATYALSFEAAGPSAGRLGGTVALYSGNNRYEVHVPDVVAAGSAAATLTSATPAVVHFPSPVTVDAAYLASLDGPNGGPCDAAFVWMKEPTPSRATALTTVMQRYEDNLRAQAATVHPLETSEASPQGAPECTQPNEPPRLLRRAQIMMVGGDQMAVGVLITEAALSDSGSVVDAWIWGWAGAPGTVSSLGDFALQETKASGYSPGTFRCKKVASIYLGVVSFNTEAPELPHV